MALSATGLEAIPRSREPYRLPGSSRAGCFLIHGFIGTPLQLRPLGHFLNGLGYSVLGVSLAGHDITPEELGRVRWQDWVGSARQSWEDFRSSYPTSALVGYSMGGLVALALARELPPSALVGLATPFQVRLQDPRAPLLPILKYFLRYVELTEELEPSEWQEFIALPYTRVSTSAIHEVLRLNAHVRRLLPEVRVPTLLLHGEQDELISLADMNRLARVLPGPVETARFPLSGHELPVGPEREAVWERMASFLEEHLGLLGVMREQPEA